MRDRVSVRDQVASAPWHRQSLGSVLRAEPRTTPLERVFARPLTTLITSIVLYLVAAAVLILTLGNVPNVAFNWEAYTARDVFALADGSRDPGSLLRLRDGLMTDSGRLPSAALPAWASFSIFGPGVNALRVPLALISALAVPAAFLLGRTVAGPGTGLLTAGLVIVSPALLVYGRTGTVVGMSVALGLATALLLLVVVQADRRPMPVRVVALAGLQLSLIAGAWMYSPIRLFWVIAVVVLVVELVAQRDHRSWTLTALGVTLIVLPAFVVLLYGAGLVASESPTWDVRRAFLGYFNAGGEQIIRFYQEPEALGQFVDVDPAATSGLAVSWDLIQGNAAALGNLLIDRGTRPAMTDQWNEHGQLYARILVPAAVAGAVLVIGRIWRSVEARVLVLTFLGLTVPLLATSQVHLGRLVFASPLLMLIAALGILWLTRLLIVQLPRLILGLVSTDHPTLRGGQAGWQLAVRVTLALLVVLFVAADAWRSDRVASLPSQAHTEQLTRAIELQRAAGVPAVALVLGGPGDVEVEQLDVTTYRLELDDQARFLNAAEAGTTTGTGDGRIDVWSGGLAGAEPSVLDRLPGGGCDVHWLVTTEWFEAFRPTLGDLAGRCGAEPAMTIVEI
ncbi:MAG TPA: hypothetical protein VGT61_16280 [Thermomicrobiales bacterium]|nr:hypothetical protein [Thermomicrobiales bacterium]